MKHGFFITLEGNDGAGKTTVALGLKEAFDKYNIGICCADLEPETIVSAIRYVDEHHAEMTKNCSAFYDAVNLDDIILKIIDFR